MRDPDNVSGKHCEKLYSPTFPTLCYSGSSIQEPPQLDIRGEIFRAHD